jgi:hypothetical protein
VHSLSRRSFFEAGIKSGLGVSLAMAESSLAQTAPPGRIRQSVCRWCYKDLSVEQLCLIAVDLGLKGVDLLEIDEFEIPRRHGLICTSQPGLMCRLFTRLLFVQCRFALGLCASTLRTNIDAQHLSNPYVVDLQS